MKRASLVVDVSNAPSWEDAAGERSTSRLAKSSSFQDKAAGRGSLTPFVVFAAEKQKSEHGD